MSLNAIYGAAQDRYLMLIRMFPLRPIRSDEELDEALNVMDGLLDQDGLDSAEADYLAVLNDIIEQYETEPRRGPYPRPLLLLDNKRGFLVLFDIELGTSGKV